MKELFLFNSYYDGKAAAFSHTLSVEKSFVIESSRKAICTGEDLFLSLLLHYLMTVTDLGHELELLSSATVSQGSSLTDRCCRDEELNQHLMLDVFVVAMVTDGRIRGYQGN